MTDNQLTDRQQEIYDYIRREIYSGRPPTVRDVGKHFRISSPNGVMCHLDALEKKGLIIRDRLKARGITLMEDTVTMPLSELEELNAQREMLLKACKAALVLVDNRGNLQFMECAAMLKEAIARAEAKP